MKVAMSEARPALINGKGTPMTGEIPSAMPMLMKIWNVKPPTTAMINKHAHAIRRASGAGDQTRKQDRISQQHQNAADEAGILRQSPRR